MLGCPYLLVAGVAAIVIRGRGHRACPPSIVPLEVLLVRTPATPRRDIERRRQPWRLPGLVRVVGICCCLEPIDILDGVKIVVKRIQVAEPLGLHIRHNAGIDEGEGFVLAKEGLPGREASVVRESM